MHSDRRISILYLIDVFNGPGSGTERHLFQLATRLDRSHFRSTVCYFEGNGKYDEPLKLSGVRPIKIPLQRMYGLEALRRSVPLMRLVRTERVDIVQTFHFKSDTYGAFISRVAGAGTVISSRRDTGDLRKKSQHLVNRFMNRHIDHYIMVCDNVGRALMSSEALPGDRSTTIHNGVDIGSFSVNGTDAVSLRRREGISEKAFVVGMTAIFRPEKCYEVLLEAVRRVRSEIDQLQVLLVGDGPTLEDCRLFCRKHGLEDRVRFAGYRTDVRDSLAVMDVFCLVPNKNEGFSNAILEAMATGKPVLATNVGGNAEAVTDGTNGFIVPPDDPEALARGILALYRDPALRRRMGRQSRLRVERDFTMAQMVRKHECLYSDLLGSRGRVTS